MAHRRQQFDIQVGQVNSLHNGMLRDSRKLAVERISKGYLLGFSHGPSPAENRAAEIIHAALQEHAGLRNGQESVELKVLLATPHNAYLSAGWQDPNMFQHFVQV